MYACTHALASAELTPIAPDDACVWLPAPPRPLPNSRRAAARARAARLQRRVAANGTANGTVEIHGPRGRARRACSAAASPSGMSAWGGVPVHMNLPEPGADYRDIAEIAASPR